MSDATSCHCPPETTAPKMHAHDATEKTEDIKPKVITTAHKRLSQDEFQRKVAMLARVKAAELEKTAIAPALAVAGATALSAIPGLYWMAGGKGGTGRPDPNYQGGALGGAGLGGLAGAVHGAFSPGEETEYDDDGNVIGKKRRGMLAGALRGGLAGAGLGAAGGLAAEHLAPGTANQLHSNAESFGKQMGERMGIRKPDPPRTWTNWATLGALA